MWTGHLHLVPVGETLLYMEPVFLAAEEDAIPELRRFVVSDGRRVSMEETLERSIQALASISSEAVELVAAANPDADVASPERSGWPSEALALLEGADAALRAGDFQRFGVALDELRSLLQNLAEPGGN